jgi:hypothetical protein
MKKHRQVNIIFFLTVQLLLIALQANGANRYSVASGNWNSTAIWSATSGGPPGASIPGKNDDVYIENGHSVTVTSNQECNSITFTGASGTLTINFPAEVSVKNSVTLNKQTESDSECFLNGTGTLTCTEVNVGTEDNPPPADPAFSSICNHTFNSGIANLSLTVKGAPKNNININSYIGGTTNLRNGVFNILSGNVEVDGMIITSNSNSLNVSTLSMATGPQTGTLLLNGASLPFDLSATGTNEINLNGSLSTVNYSRGGTQTVLGTVYNNLTLSVSGVKTLNGVTVLGTLSREGSASCTGTSPVFGPLSAIQYKGSGGQTTGIEFPTLFEGSGGLIIDNLSGVTLNNNRNLTSKLTFVNGKLNTATYSITLSPFAEVVGAGTGKYVNGNLCKVISVGTTAKTFEIGDAAVYAPLSLEFSGIISSEGQINAKTTLGDHPNIGSSTFNIGVTVNRYWTLTNQNVSGFISCRAKFQFAASDVDAGADYNNFYIGQYFSGDWYYPALGTLEATISQATGLTTFGDFQIGERPIASYRTRQSGDWNLTSTWESFDGSNWVPALATPTSTSGYVTIRSPHIINNTSPVTVDQLIIDEGGCLDLYADLVLNDGPAFDFSVNGALNCISGNVTGTGSFFLYEFADLNITSPEGITLSGSAGNILTSTRMYSPWGNYSYTGTSSQATGNGLPSSVNNLTINNIEGVALTNYLTVNGILSLTSGSLALNDGTLAFQQSDTPVIRSSGTIQTSVLSNLSFGTPADSTGADFVLPEGMFNDPANINNLTLVRINPLTLNDQDLFVHGTVLTHGVLNTNDKIVLVSDASGTALIDGRSRGTVNGNVTMQRYLPSAFGYKYFSSPFQSATVGEFSDDMDLTAPFTTFYRYDENRNVGGNPASGWVTYKTPSNVLHPLAGYAVNFGSSADPGTVDVKGVVNNGPLSVTLYNNNNPYTLGFNLVGNPYPSPVDWDAASGWTKVNIDAAIYFFSASTTDQYGGTYSSYVGGIPSGGPATNIIPSMQGFFIHVSDDDYPVSATLGLDNSVRITNMAQSFFKSDNKNTKPLIRLNAGYSDDPESSDPLVIYFDEKATEGFDSKLDALKLMNTDLSVANLYSVIPEGKKLSINGLPLINDDMVVIPLGLRTYRDGFVNFSISHIEESLTGIEVSLTDMAADREEDLLSGGSYRIRLAAGEYNNRFYLNLSPLSTEIPSVITDNPLFSVYNHNGILRAEFKMPPGESGLLIVHDLTGRILLSRKIYDSGYQEFNHNYRSGVYIATFMTGKRKDSRKIIILGP